LLSFHGQPCWCNGPGSNFGVHPCRCLLLVSNIESSLGCPTPTPTPTESTRVGSSQLTDRLQKSSTASFCCAHDFLPARTELSSNANQQGRPSSTRRFPVPTVDAEHGSRRQAQKQRPCWSSCQQPRRLDCETERRRFSSFRAFDGIGGSSTARHQHQTSPRPALDCADLEDRGVNRWPDPSSAPSVASFGLFLSSSSLSVAGELDGDDAPLDTSTPKHRATVLEQQYIRRR